MDREKRELRREKRIIKRAGNKRVRRLAREMISESPEDAPFVEPDYGRYRSAERNGIDQDATRRRPPDAD